MNATENKAALDDTGIYPLSPERQARLAEEARQIKSSATSVFASDPGILEKLYRKVQNGPLGGMMRSGKGLLVVLNAVALGPERMRETFKRPPSQVAKQFAMTVENHGTNSDIPNNPNETFYFMNGILTSKGKAEQYKNILKGLIGENVELVYNLSKGATSDLRESVRVINFRDLPECGRKLYGKIKEDLLAGKTVKVFGHSEGGAITSSVINLIAKDDELVAHLDRLDLYTFGSAASTVNINEAVSRRLGKPVPYVENFSTDDFVADIGAFAPANQDQISALNYACDNVGHNFFNYIASAMGGSFSLARNGTNFDTPEKRKKVSKFYSSVISENVKLAMRTPAQTTEYAQDAMGGETMGEMLARKGTSDKNYQSINRSLFLQNISFNEQDRQLAIESNLLIRNRMRKMVRLVNRNDTQTMSGHIKKISRNLARLEAERDEFQVYDIGNPETPVFATGNNESSFLAVCAPALYNAAKDPDNDCASLILDHAAQKPAGDRNVTDRVIGNTISAAIQSGHQECARKALELIYDYNSEPILTALDTALEYDNDDISNEILKKITTEEGYSQALCSAIFTGHEKLAKTIAPYANVDAPVYKTADVFNVKDSYSANDSEPVYMNALGVAIASKNDALIEDLYSRSNDKAYAIVQACLHESHDVLPALLSNIESITDDDIDQAAIACATKDYIDCLDILPYNETSKRTNNRILRSAAAYGSIDCMKRAISNGVSEQSLDDAVVRAGTNGHNECVLAALVTMPAYKRISNRPAALEKAAAKGYADCVKTLMRYSHRDIKLITRALVKASENGQLECVKMLAKNSDARLYSSAALRKAAANGHTECVEALIDISDPKANRSEAFDFAVTNKHIDCALMLKPFSDAKVVKAREGYLQSLIHGVDVDNPNKATLGDRIKSLVWGRCDNNETTLVPTKKNARASRRCQA